MAALTYFFARLGPHPLDSIEPAQASPPAPPKLSPAPVLGRPPASAEEPRRDEPPAEQAQADDAMAAGTAAEPPTLDESSPDRARGDATASARRRERAPTDDAQAGASVVDEARVTPEFPEFTDSSRPLARERAADGPRIDSLFERAGDPTDESQAPVTNPPEPERGPARAVSSCEAAIARNSEQLEIGGPRGPADISREAYASILQNGSYLAACSVPERTVLEICAAVKDGWAVGVTVVSNPSQAGLNACVRSAVTRLKFPQNPRLDVTHTRFDAVRR